MPQQRPAPASDRHGPTADAARCPRPTAARSQWRARSEQGSSAIELVLVTSVLIALVFGLIQAGLLWNTRHVVGSAAQHGARVARTATALDPSVSTVASTPHGTDGAVTAGDEQIMASTLAFLRQTGGRSLTDPSVTVRRDGAFVTVTVSGTTLGVLPGTHVRVSSSSRTPLEGYRP